MMNDDEQNEEPKERRRMTTKKMMSRPRRRSSSSCCSHRRQDNIINIGTTSRSCNNRSSPSYIFFSTTWTFVLLLLISAGTTTTTTRHQQQHHHDTSSTSSFVAGVSAFVFSPPDHHCYQRTIRRTTTRNTLADVIRPSSTTTTTTTTSTSSSSTTKLHLNLISSVFFNPTSREQEQKAKAASKTDGGDDAVVAVITTRAQHNKNKNINIPFLIELVPEYSNDKTYQDIAAMCIQAFFNDDDDSNNNNDSNERQSSNKKNNNNKSITTTNNNNNKIIAPWKAAQLAYLRALQTGDLKVRRHRDKRTNMMFVAREIVPASSDNNVSKTQPLILPNQKHVYNLPSPSFLHGDDASYVRGNVLGFVEVTKRRYGLPKDYQKQQKQKKTTISSLIINNGDDNDTTEQQQPNIVRPVLTNLSVRREARELGLGSKLLQICEAEVMNQWNMYEIVLEVEDDNELAKRFYEKRGYKRIFDDPTSRKYDLSGLWLREIRCKRNVLRKYLRSSPPSLVLPSGDNNANGSSSSSPTFDAINSLLELFRK